MGYSPWAHKELDTTEHACLLSSENIPTTLLGVLVELGMSEEELTFRFGARQRGVRTF